MRWVFVSLVVHALLIAWLARGDETLVAWTPPALPAIPHVETPTVIALIEEPAGGGGGSVAAPHRAARAASIPKRSPDAWEQIDVQVENAASGNGNGNRSGNGNGNGNGNGIGSGIGLGNGSVRIPDDIPMPPPPPKISKARPAKLVWPTRDEEVEDEASLFAVKVTVDEQGFVVGARMLASRTGPKAERAANAIWTFRYSPALDDDGRPIRSTFEQSFQVR